MTCGEVVLGVAQMSVVSNLPQLTNQIENHFAYRAFEMDELTTEPAGR